MPRYFLDLPEEQPARAWDPRAGPHPERMDTRYFGTAFLEMERRLQRPDVDVYLTWNCERLPASGDRVVAVVLGDEVGRIPRYISRVRAVFKAYGTRPVLGAGLLRDPSITGLASAGQFAVRCLRWLPSASAYTAMRIGERAGRGPAPAPVATIPLGTYNQLDLPLLPMAERESDLFFAGSVEHDHSLHHRFLSPKTHARRQMLAAVERFAATRPRLRADMRVTPSFGASAAAAAGDYSRSLMNARICLAPRGTSLETFRVFEGLRAGCVVVGDRLPRHPFYSGAPLIQLNRWNDLADTLPGLLDDPTRLERAHAAALDWWREQCSEQALGRFMAERLNSLDH
jgi:hypothetical protein